MKTSFHSHPAIVYALAIFMAWPVSWAAVTAGDTASHSSLDSGEHETRKTAEKNTSKTADGDAEFKKSAKKKSSAAIVADEATTDNASDKSSRKTHKASEKGVKKASAGKKTAGEKAFDGDLLDRPSEAREAIPIQENLLAWLYRSMGLKYVIVFLVLTFNEVSLVVVIVLGLRRTAVCPPQLIEEFEAILKQKKYQEAFELANKDGSLLGRVLAAGMAGLPDGYESALEAMRETGQEQTVRLEQRNGNIALIAQIGPMLGLLATVDGIVRSFAVIADREVTPKPSELAQGIGVALVNTIVGLTIAIASIVIYHYARNRLTRLTLEAGTISGRLMKRFSKVRPQQGDGDCQGEKAYAV